MNNIYNLLIIAATPPNSVPQVPINDTLLTNVLNAAFMFAGVVAVIFIIIGGIQYSGSAGDPNKVTGAKNTLTYAIIGLVVVAFSLLIVNFVIGQF